MYYLLTESFKSNEEKIVKMIQEAVAVEKIYMLGSTLMQQRTESVFMTDAPSRRNAGHYWLMVLIDKDCGHSDSYVQDKIENTCQHFIPVTVIVLDTTQFNNWLKEGHRFACTVIKIAVLLHDNTNIPLVIPNITNVDDKKAESYHTQGINKVNEFMAGADFYRIRKQNKMTAFMLHQAAEHALHAILKKATGFHVNTHNIDKLIRYCSMVNYKIDTIFPREGETNKRLLSLLQKSYIDTRYKEDFTIGTNDLLILTEKIKIIKQMMEDCTESNKQDQMI